MTPRVHVCTPVIGSPSTAQVSLAYHESTQLLQGVEYMESRFYTNCDLVRARSRAVAHFLETDGTHLLFWDADVIPKSMHVVGAMLAADKDVIAAPYPRKHINYQAMAEQVRNEDEQAERGRQTADDLEAAGTEWPTQYDGDPVIEPGGLVRAAYIGCGFMLIKREVLERLVEAHREALTFADSSTGSVKQIVGVFMLTIRGGMLLGEDYSFCERVRELGGELWAILDPADHVGPHRFRGQWRGLVDAHV